MAQKWSWRRWCDQFRGSKEVAALKGENWSWCLPWDAHNHLGRVHFTTFGDTLKRLVKAGDGTILATSPTYTQFLSAGVHYAIISPGMPLVDLWVQEFLKREMPCVVADYLVEYICKPGYSMDRHVLYNTNAWAEKSYADLLNMGEETVLDFTPSDGGTSDDAKCQVCGSRDRGEVILICGNESCCLGCGVGMHMDCCDPPLENIPEGLAPSEVQQKSNYLHQRKR